jgi:hypothetical protein
VRVTVYLSVEILGINAVINYKFMLSFIVCLYCLKQSSIDVWFVLLREGGYVLLLLYISLRYRRVEEQVHADSRMSRLVMRLSGRIMINVRHKTW